MTPMGVFFTAIFPLEINEQALCQQPHIVHNSKPADANEIRLSSICTAYNPDWYTSKYVYDDIKSNIERLIEDAITIRNRYPK